MPRIRDYGVDTGRCPRCGDAYDLPAEMRDETMSGECWTCGLTTSSPAGLTAHIHTAHNRTPYDQR